MLWIFLAVLGYFFGAVALIIDKFLLASKRIRRPAGYAFLTSLLSLFALVFAFFEPRSLDWVEMSVAFFSGFVFVYGLLFLYLALDEHPVSVAAPLVSIVGAGVTLLPVLFEAFWRMETVVAIAPLLFAFGCLVMGGFLVSSDLSVKNRVAIHWKPIFFAGVFLAGSYLVLKYGYSAIGVPFAGGVVWSRLGLFAGGCSLYLFPRYRQEIRETLGELVRPVARKMHAVTGTVFVTGKVLGGLTLLLVNGAIFLGPVSLVQAMDGLRFGFVFILAHLLARPYPEIFQEQLGRWQWLQKIVAIGFLMIGLWLATTVTGGVM